MSAAQRRSGSRASRSRASANTSDVIVDIDGHRLKLTNLEKVLYPETGTTKADVLQYYSEIADHLIPHTRDRAATRKRWVHGVGTAEHPGEMFFQKNLDDSTPSWVRRHAIEHSDHANEYPLVNDRATLTWLAQIAALELHVPQWRFGPRGARRNPDRLVLDLDPGDGVGLAECVEVAKLARTILQGMGLEPVPVTSGSKGIHLYAALDGSQSSDQVSAVAHELARILEVDNPDLIVSDMKKTLRVGRVLVDWSQNNGSKTTVAPYSLRGRSQPTVAAPRTWRELASPTLAQLDYTEVLARVKRRGDPLAVLLGGGEDGGSGGELTVPEAAQEGADRDRLHTYRSMRDGAKTPEPVPDAEPSPGAGNTFVIQKHDATRLHYDFRLEHDGVLVSWAIPKGPPTDVKVNHLAVQTEAHPLEYATFAGTIPKGEYGGGTVEIWDEGTYDLEKWRDGKEVIATLHGTKAGGLGGDRKFALIHTGSRGGGSGGGRGSSADDEKGARNWLIHRMELEYTKAQEEKHRGLPPQPDDEAPAINAARSAGRAIPGKLVAPMLATLGAERDLGEQGDWAFEMKWDGIRAVAYVDPPSATAPATAPATVRLLTRNGNDVTSQYPDLLDPIRASVGAHSAVLDGEIVALDEKGRPNFSRLQQRMNLQGEAEVARAARSVAVHYLVFDLLHLDGRSMQRESYDDRRELLESAVVPDARSRVQVPQAFDGDFAAAFASSRALGLEGIMAKKHESTYGAGRRSRAWIKIKHHFSQEVVVGGWRPGKGRRADTIGSLLLGIPDGDTLRYVGRVGTGFSDTDLARLAGQVADLTRDTTPFADAPRDVAADAHWIEPTLVGEVEFAEWTASGHLRQPSWRGWRTDKAPSDVVREG
ncbi:ATP-dependent DNA ligase [Subtercola boreus]|uniref:DNA ligase (ATP) n=1 Tax=Subtercola boreus TaxID=120213 RepID=A0A3E0VJM3_9MICO|nr:ATP-dependent DNA ligase [Subtercola boreus]RFA09688.1 ATP-dependent DNA ligase [Subtercola boreus]TQL53223.1 ATP-dependent DNA ligase LigD ligase module /ATP-dependent DNA ligase LigD phosphoesterase module /ATP-dependent DNA ligase LigD polymerase module [Subtercola boreus]